MPSSGENLVPLGVILSAHGVRGGVKLRSFTEIPTDLASYGSLVGAGGTPPVTILSLKPVGERDFLAYLKGVSDRKGASLLRGLVLHVPRSSLPEPEEDVWYHADLVGLSVLGAGGEKIGSVTGVGDYGAGAFLEITGCEGGVDLLPFSRSFVPHVDIAKGYILALLPDGFLKCPTTPASCGRSDEGR